MTSASPGDKVMEGEDGFLFLTKDANRVGDQHQGRRLLDADELAIWERTLRTREAYCRHHGIGYYLLMVPDKYRVYRHKLPSDFEYRDARPGRQFSRLAASILGGRHCDATRVLTKAARESLVFHKGDTHWDARGAFLAYEQLVEAVNGELRLEKAERPVFRLCYGAGDLGGKLEPVVRSAYSSALMRRRSRTVYDNKIVNTGRLIVQVNEDASLPICLLIGTSSAVRYLLGYLGESFGKVIFLWDRCFDYELIAALRPDVIVNQFGERFLVKPIEERARLSAFDMSVVNACLLGPDERELEALRRALDYPPLERGPVELLAELALRLERGVAARPEQIACLILALRNTGLGQRGRRLALAAGVDEAAIRRLAEPRVTARRIEGQVVALKASGCFDEGFYLQAYPEVAADQVDAVHHYVTRGWRELKDPSPRFSTRRYLERHPGLWEGSLNPLLHALRNEPSEA